MRSNCPTGMSLGRFRTSHLTPGTPASRSDAVFEATTEMSVATSSRHCGASCSVKEPTALPSSSACSNCLSPQSSSSRANFSCSKLLRSNP